MIRRDAWSRLRATTRTAASSAFRRDPDAPSRFRRPAPLTMLAAAALLVPIGASTLQSDGVRLEAQPSAPVPSPSAAAPDAGTRPVPGMFLARPGALPVSLLTAPGLGAGSNTSAISARVLQSYKSAQASLAKSDPGCGLEWWMLAGIGRIESGHAAGGQLDAQGTTIGRIYGPLLDGTTPNTAVIRDSDGGVFDGDTTYDRAVGPMQFLPGTWKFMGRDGNGDGTADPNNMDDAAVSAGAYLCSSGGNLADASRLRAAVLSYNNSEAYVNDVISAGLAYRDGRTPPAPWVPSLVPGSAPTATPLRPSGARTTVEQPVTPAPRATLTRAPAPPRAPAQTPSPAGSANGTTPTGAPTSSPTSTPTSAPTSSPGTSIPTSAPTSSPGTSTPTAPPTSSPSTGTPTSAPTSAPTSLPGTSIPTATPTSTPSTSTSTVPLPPCPTPTTPTPTQTDGETPTSSPTSPTDSPSPEPSPTCIPVPTDAASATATGAEAQMAPGGAGSGSVTPTPASTAAPSATRR